MVRGVILSIAPGQESTSLLISPEGWLIGLVDIQNAEDGRLEEPPWCFVKTQFGPVEGHVLLVEILAALKREFFSELDVSDDGSYWETRDFAELVRRRALTEAAIGGLAEGLRRHGLSREAAEDPSILLRHIERVAEQVHRILSRPAEHPPLVHDEDDRFGGRADPEATEKLWDELTKQNRRQQERLQRAIEERRRRGLEEETAFRDAAGRGTDLPDGEPDRFDEPWHDDVDSRFADSSADSTTREDAGIWQEDEEPFEVEEEPRHPLLQRAMDLLLRLDSIFPDSVPTFDRSMDTLYRAPATRSAAWRKLWAIVSMKPWLLACASYSSSVPSAALRLPAVPSSRFDRPSAPTSSMSSSAGLSRWSQTFFWSWVRLEASLGQTGGDQEIAASDVSDGIRGEAKREPLTSHQVLNLQVIGHEFKLT